MYRLGAVRQGGDVVNGVIYYRDGVYVPYAGNLLRHVWRVWREFGNAPWQIRWIVRFGKSMPGEQFCRGFWK